MRAFLEVKRRWEQKNRTFLHKSNSWMSTDGWKRRFPRDRGSHCIPTAQQRQSRAPYAQPSTALLVPKCMPGLATCRATKSWPNVAPMYNARRILRIIIWARVATSPLKLSFRCEYPPERSRIFLPSCNHVLILARFLSSPRAWDSTTACGLHPSRALILDLGTYSCS